MASVSPQRKRRKLTPNWYTIPVVIVSVVLMFCASVVYTNHVDQRNRREWCELLTFYTDYYAKNPPQNDLAKQQAQLMHRRVVALGC